MYLTTIPDTVYLLRHSHHIALRVDHTLVLAGEAGPHRDCPKQYYCLALVFIIQHVNRQNNLSRTVLSVRHGRGHSEDVGYETDWVT